MTSHQWQAKTFRSADGTTIYAEARGNPRKPAIVFIHGFSMSTLVWNEALSDPRWINEAYLVAYDGRGHGRSGKPEDEASWESNRIAEDFEAVVEGFGLVQPFVACWSLGGVSLADILAHKPSSYISGAILLAGFPYIASIPKVITPSGFQLISPLMAVDSVPTFQDTALTFIGSLTAPSNPLPHLFRQALLGDVMVQPRACSARILSRTQDPKGLFDAGEKGLPYLIINGSEDPLVQSSENERALREPAEKEGYTGWKDLKVVLVEGAGHMPFWEKPDIVRNEVLEFVKRVGGSAPSQCAWL